MKVLLCTPYDFSNKTPGGISIWAANIVDYYRQHSESDIDLDVFACTRTHYVNENTGFLHRLYYGVIDYFHFIREIWHKVKIDQIHVVHVNTTASIGAIKDIFLCLLLRKRAKVFLHYHFGRIPTLVRSSNWEWKLVHWSIKLSYKAIVMDHASYKALQSIPLKNIVELPNPYSPKLEYLISTIQKRIKRKKHRILYAGRVFRQKGVFELVEACSRIHDIELRMVGPYEEFDKQRLEEIAKNESWLCFIGPVSHESVIEEMLSADIFVMPTYNEGFPNAVLECMITKTPIIVTPVGAIPEMLNFENDPCGIKIRKYNVDDIETAIKMLMDNDNAKELMTQKAYSRVKELYSLEQVGMKLFNIWKS